MGDLDKAIAAANESSGRVIIAEQSQDRDALRAALEDCFRTQRDLLAALDAARERALALDEWLAESKKAREQMRERLDSVGAQSAAAVVDVEPVAKSVYRDDGVVGVHWLRLPPGGIGNGTLLYAAAPVCDGCNGRGEIGGPLGDGTYQTDPCPWCTQAPPAAAVPDGYALVPVEPTEVMLDAGVEAQIGTLYSADGSSTLEDARWRMTRAAYAAMLAAAERKGE